MKTLGRILIGIAVLFLGMTAFNYANGLAIHKDISEQGDAGVKDNDLTMFINRFEYYKETPLIDEHIIVNDDVSFDLNIYQQANVKNNAANYLTVLVRNLTIEDREKELKLKIDYKVTKQEEKDYITLISIGEENWYLQWMGLLFDEIDSISIYHENLLLYEYEGEKPFLSAKDYDMASFIKGNSVYNGVLTNIAKDIEYTNIPDRGANLGEEILYEIDFNFKTTGLDELGDLYLEGYFNDFNTDHETYKLIKNKNGLYENKFNFTSEYERLVFTLVTEEGDVVTNGDGEVVYFIFNYLDEENFDINNFDIYKSIPQDFDKYSHYKWIVLIIYSAVLIIISVIVFLVKNPKSSKVTPVYKNPNEEKIVETEKKN